MHARPGLLACVYLAVLFFKICLSCIRHIYDLQQR